MSSSKSSRIINSHIVETNASGIVTIVIDDDIKESNNDMNDSNSEYSPTSVVTRPAIGVRTPISSLGSPKFINSENCQNLLIKENKTNVIVVNSGRSSGQGLFRAGQMCLSSSSSCCSSDSMPTEIRTHHNIVSKTQTHYVMINKPKPSVSSESTPSSHTSSQSTLEFTIKASPTKLRLWTQPGGQSTPRSPPVTVSVRNRSHTLPPEDVESDCMDDQTFFKYLNLIRTHEFKQKPIIDLKSSWPLRKVTKIPKPDSNSEGNILLANFKTLKEPIRTVPNMTQALSERKLRWYREAQHYNDRLQKFKANLQTMNSMIRQRIQLDLEKLHKRLMSEKQRQTIEEEKYRRLKNQEQNQRQQKDELRQELNSYSNSFEISSIMGRRVRLSLENSTMTAVDVFKYIENRIESHCKLKDIVAVTAPQNTKLSTRITRSTTGFAGIDRMWGPRNESHQYSFTRKQRLNRYHRIDTGLNWKSRLVKKHCRRIDVEVAKITRCPCCLEVVEPEWGHSCRDSDEESIPEVSSINDSDFCGQSESNFNEEEINSRNSEIINTDVMSCLCGQYVCSCECVHTTQVAQISSPSVGCQLNTLTERTVFFSNSDDLLPVKSQIEDTVMIHKVAVLHTTDNKNDLIKRIGNSVKRINEQNLAPNHKRFISDSEDDIVVISEVSADSQSQTAQDRSLSTGTELIESYLIPNSDMKPTIRKTFPEKRLRPQSLNDPIDQVIVKRLK